MYESPLSEEREAVCESTQGVLRARLRRCSLKDYIVHDQRLQMLVKLISLPKAQFCSLFLSTNSSSICLPTKVFFHSVLNFMLKSTLFDKGLIWLHSRSSSTIKLHFRFVILCREDPPKPSIVALNSKFVMEINPNYVPDNWFCTELCIEP